LSKQTNLKILNAKADYFKSVNYLSQLRKKYLLSKQTTLKVFLCRTIGHWASLSMKEMPSHVINPVTLTFFNINSNPKKLSDLNGLAEQQGKEGDSCKQSHVFRTVVRCIQNIQYVIVSSMRQDKIKPVL
jgi:hypothetical protein